MAQTSAGMPMVSKKYFSLSEFTKISVILPWKIW